MMEPFEMTVAQSLLALREKEISARELIRSYVKRITEVEPAIRGFISLLPEEMILAQAEKVDKLLASGQPVHPLAGIPFALKDNMCTRTLATTCASRMLKDYIPPYDAHVT